MIAAAQEYTLQRPWGAHLGSFPWSHPAVCRSECSASVWGVFGWVLILELPHLQQCSTGSSACIASCMLGKSPIHMTDGARCHAAVTEQQCSRGPSCHVCTLVCFSNTERHHLQ